MAKNRSRRLRKKLRIDEFQELGFKVEIQASDGADMLVLLDELLIEAIESNGMAFGGGCDQDDGKISGFVTKSAGGTLAEEDQKAVNDWLSARQEVRDFEVGDLVDANYG
jgi:uncharacterized protein YggL (DUF469 family)